MNIEKYISEDIKKYFSEEFLEKCNEEVEEFEKLPYEERIRILIERNSEKAE